VGSISLKSYVIADSAAIDEFARYNTIPTNLYIFEYLSPVQYSRSWSNLHTTGDSTIMVNLYVVLNMYPVLDYAKRTYRHAVTDVGLLIIGFTEANAAVKAYV
jgi:hypothetical protein